MFSLKLTTVAVLTSFVLSGAMPRSCRSKSRDNKNMVSTSNDSTGDLKVLAEGSISPIKTSFVGVFRDAETYAALRAQAGNLPELKADFFKSNIVIAAFLGERNTGGYGVVMVQEPNGKIRIAEKAPPKDAIVTQMITSPFKLVSMPTNGTSPVELSLDARFNHRAQLYRISNGSFTVSGGFAGGTEQFKLAGKLQVMRLAGVVSIGFAIVSEGAPREHSLRDFATGVVSGDSVAITRLSRGTLIDSPSGDLTIHAKFAEKNRLLIDLTTGPVIVPDGYSGKGTIEAELVAASANAETRP
jgi:PrcB C-terminal